MVEILYGGAGDAYWIFLLWFQGVDVDGVKIFHRPTTLLYQFSVIDLPILFVSFQVWFKNRRAKWRKRERNQMNAIAAADFKNGFGTQFVQPFADTDSLYSSYSHYNNWAKVPSPLGTKTFPWPVNPLGSVVSSNHHQNSINCFNTSASSVAASMSTGNMLTGGMGTTAPSVQGTATCPYTTPTNPYSMYHHRGADTCSSSIATLRLKAKQHSTGFGSPYSMPSPVSRSNSSGLVSSNLSSGLSSGLSACQYAGFGVGLSDTVGWDNALTSIITSTANHHHHLLTASLKSFDLMAGIGISCEDVDDTDDDLMGSGADAGGLVIDGGDNMAD